MAWAPQQQQRLAAAFRGLNRLWTLSLDVQPAAVMGMPACCAARDAVQQLCQKQVAVPLRLFGADKATRHVPAAVRAYVNLEGE